MNAKEARDIIRISSPSQQVMLPVTRAEAIGYLAALEGEEMKANRELAHELVQTIQWLAQTYHQAHHDSGIWQGCRKNTCDAARKAVYHYLETATPQEVKP